MNNHKRTHRAQRGFDALLLCALLWLLTRSSLQANPVGESVVAGSASFSRSGPGLLTIQQNSDRAIIHWQEFSIGAGELTRFVQPGANAAALNRVLSGAPSALYGTLQANGQLILLNPAGILVGPSGRVDTQGLLASTLNLSDEDFLMGLGGTDSTRSRTISGPGSDWKLGPRWNASLPGKGRWKLSGDSKAAVQNAGVVTGGRGSVYLVAREVQNAGTIQAARAGLVGGGEVELAGLSSKSEIRDQNSEIGTAGVEVVLGDRESGIGVLRGSGQVMNSGLIEAALAELRAVGDNVHALAINNSGIVRATAVAQEGGQIILKAESGVVVSNGTLEASGKKGGAVQVLGDRVGLTGLAKVDVSGETQGGTALIGGDYQGGRASDGALDVEEVSQVRVADSLNMNGPLHPSSLPLGGGENSPKHSDFESLNDPLSRPADTLSPSEGERDGVRGSVREEGVRRTGEGDPTISRQGNQSVLRSAATIKNAERTVVGRHVTIEAEGRETGLGGKVIVWSDELTAYGGTIRARGGLVEVSGKESLAFTGWVDAAGGSVLLDPRDITIQASGTAAHDALLSDAQILFNGAGLEVNTQDLVLSGSAITALTGNIMIQAHRDLTISTPLNLSNQTSGSVVFQAGEDMTISESVSTGGATLSITASDAGGIGGSTAAAATLTITGAIGSGSTGNVTLANDGSGGIRLGNNVTSTGNVTFSHVVTLTANTTVTALNATFSGTVNGATIGGQTLTINASGTTTFASQVGNVTQLASITTDSGGTMAFNGTLVRTTGAQTYNDPVTLGATMTLTSTASGNISLNSTVSNTTSRDLTVNTAGLMTFGGTVGSGTELLSVTTDSAGTTILQGGLIRTSSTQVYNDNVILAANTTITTTTEAQVIFRGTIDADLAGNNRTLTMNSSGSGTFTRSVGGTQRLAALTTDSGGQTVVGTAGITATVMTFSDPLLVTGNAVLTGTTVSLNGTVNGAVNGAQNLTINADGATTFAGVVGATTRLATLTTDSAGTTVINANVAATSHLYNDPVTVGANLTFTGTSVSFNSTLNGDIVDDRQVTINASGTTTFSGVVGGTAILRSLVTDVAGTTVLGASVASIIATTITLADSVTLNAGTTTLQGSTVTLGAVNGGATARHLVINANGATTLGGNSGSTTALGSVSTDASGSLTLQGNLSTSTTGGATGDQIYQEPVTLLGAPVLTATGAGADVTFSSTINATTAGVQTLTINAAGTTTLPSGIGLGADGLIGTADDKTLGLLRISSTTGTLALNGGAVRATSQSYSGPVTLGANTTLQGTTVTFGTSGTLNSDATARSLTLNATGITFGAAVGGSAALSSLTTGTGGSTTLRDVTTTGAQTYNNAVVLGAAATLTSSGSGNITFGSSVSGAFALTVNTSGTTAFNGAVSGIASLTTDAGTAGGTTIGTISVSSSGAQTYNDPVTLTQNVTFTSTANGNITFNNTVDGAKSLTVNTAGTTTFGDATTDAVGGTTALTTLTTNNGAGSDTTVINTATITTTGAQSYNDDVTLGTGVTLSSGTGNVTFALTVNGANALTVNSTGTTRFTGRVGGTTALTSLTTNSGGTLTLSGGITGGNTVTTTGALTFNDPATLTAATILNSGAGAITLGSTVNGAFAFTVTSSGAKTFSGAVGGTAQLISLTVNGGGTTAINATSMRATTHTYTDNVTLGANPTITGTTVTFTGTVNADAAFNNRQLTVNATTTTFSGNIGATASLGSLTTDTGTSHVTTVNGITVTATTVTFNDPITLATGPVAVAATTVTFGNTVNGAQALTVNASGAATATFASTVGATTPLTSLTMDAGDLLSGTTLLSGNISTTGAQTYNDAVILAANTILSSSGSGAINFAKTLNADYAVKNRTLTINTAGATTFSQAVGGIAPLASLVTDSVGTLSLGGGTVASGTITFGESATLTAHTTLTGANITLAGATGAFNLTVSGTGTTTVSAAISGLAELKFDNDGTTVLNADITTTGKQTYSDAVTVSGTRTLAAGSGDILFNSTINGASDLSVSTTGATTFGGAVGGTTPLTSLTTVGGGTLTVSGGSITTSGAQTYVETMVLGAHTTLAGTTPTFNATEVTGSGFDLTLNFSSDHTLDAGFSGIRSLSTGGGGNTRLDAATYNLAGSATFNDAVVLLGNAVVQASDITLAAVSGAFTLQLTGAGTTTLGGAITGVTSLTVDGGGPTVLSTDVTVATQSYSADTVSLNAATVTLSGSTSVTLGTVTGNGKNLTLTGATMNLNGPISGVAALNVTGTTAINLDASGSTSLTISTTGAQTYNNAVTMTDATTTFTSTGSGNITFSGTLNGAANDVVTLAVNTSGVTVLTGAVGGSGRPQAITTDSGGTTRIMANITGNNAITFNDPVELLGDVTVASQSNQDITFGSTVNSSGGARDLTVNTTGNTVFSGAVGGGSALDVVTTNSSGTTHIDGGTVTGATLTFNDNIELNANTTLTGTANPTFGGSITSQGAATYNLTLNFAGATTTINGATTIPAGEIQDLTFSAGGTATSLTGTLSTTGTQTYNSPVTLAGTTTLTSTGLGSAGNISFAAAATINGTVANTQSLTVNTSGTTSFAGIIGGGTTLAALTTDAGTGGGVTLSANIITDGAIMFNEAATLGGAVAITTSNDAVTFNSTVNGAQTLSIATGATITFTGAVGGSTALTSLTTLASGAVTIGGGQVTTTGTQSYGGMITLGANTVMIGSTPTFAASGVSGSASNYELTLNFSGPTEVHDNFLNLGKLTSTGGGTTTIAGSISLAGGSQVMTFNDNVTFSAASTTLTATDIYFGGTVSAGGNNVILASSGTTTLASTYTSTTGTLTSNGGGTTVLTGNVNTGSGSQTYSADSVRLAVDITLTTSDATGVTLGAVNGTGDGTESLTVTGNAVIAAGGVGTTSGKRLEALSISGTTSLGSSVTTTGTQIYTGAVTLTAATSDPVLTGSTPTFTAGVTTGNGSDLTLNFSGTTALVGANFVGIAALTTGGGGTTTITGALTTTGAMTFNDAVQLVGNMTLDSAAAALAFNSTLDSDSTGGRTLTIASTGTQAFAGAVGSSVALGALDTGTGAITISGGSVNTGTANQTYDGTITLGANATLTGGTPAFAAGGVDGSASNYDLTLNFSGGTTLTTAFINLGSLTTGGGGTTTINGSMTTARKQTYNESVVIAGGAVTRTLTSNGSGSNGDITFNSTINATTANTESLSIISSGTTTFAGSIGLGANGVFGGGDDLELANLITDAGTAGGTTISGGTVFATTADFNDTVNLGLGTVIKGTTTNFDHATAIRGNGHSLTLGGGGITLIGGNVSSVSSLIRDVGTTTFGASAGSTAIFVTTTGAQFYTGALTLNQNATLTGSSVTSATTAINAPGTTTVTSKTLTVSTVP